MRLLPLAVVLLAVAQAAALPGQDDLAGDVQRLASPDGNVRSKAYQDLSRRNGPELVALLAAKFTTLPRDGQQYAVYLLQGQPIAVTRDAMKKFQKDPQPYVRAVGAALLFRGGEKEAATVLAAAMQAATDDADRLSMLNVTWNVDDPAVLAAMRSYIAPGRGSGVVQSALSHLRRAERPLATATITAARAFADTDEVYLRATVLACLVGTDDGTAAKTLAAHLRAKPESAAQARSMLGDGKLPAELVEAFAQTLAEPRNQYDIRPTAELVQAQAPGLAVPALRALLRHKNDDFRAAAVDALAAIPGGLDDKDLQALLHGASVAERLTAAAMLRRRDDLSGLPVVLELLPTAGAKKAEAVRLLGSFRVRTVGPALLDLLDDPDQNVRSAAWAALQDLMRDLFPYRRFDFAKCGYEPGGGDRGAAIARLRAWWTAVPPTVKGQ